MKGKYTEKNAYFCPICGNVLIPKRTLLDKNILYLKCSHCNHIFFIKKSKVYQIGKFIFNIASSVFFLLPIPKSLRPFFKNHFFAFIVFLIMIFIFDLLLREWQKLNIEIIPHAANEKHLKAYVKKHLYMFDPQKKKLIKLFSQKVESPFSLYPSNEKK